MTRKKAPIIKDAFEYYFKAIKMAPGTKMNYSHVLHKVDEAGLLDLPLKDITPAVIRKLINDQPQAQSTVHVFYVQLKSVLNRYIQDHAMNISMAGLNGGIIKKPKLKPTMVGEEEYLTFTELKDLLAVDLEKDPRKELARDAFCLMCLTGMAVGDLLKFTPECVSADGKWIHYKRIKNGNGCPVPMLPLTHALIFKEVYSPNNLEEKKPRVWPLKVQKRAVQTWCEVIITQLMGRKMTSHMGRHSFGTIMLEFGFSLETVSKFMGHSSVLITGQVYAKVTHDKIERELRNLPAEIRESMKVD